MQHSIEHHAVLVPSAEISHIDISSLRSANTEVDSVPHTIVSDDIDTCRYFASHNYYLPGPITWDYHWPTYFDAPFSHQIATANFFTLHKRAFCFNQLGTGKTLSTLWAADYLQMKGEIRKVLIVSTLSTLESVWTSDIFRHFPGKTSTILHGSRERRVRELARDVDFYIINHDGIAVILPELIARHDIDLVVIDESAVYRNSKTDLYKAITPLVHIDTGRWLWLLTGSPMPSAPTDVWAQAKLVNPALVPQYFSRFRSLVMFKADQYKWVPLSGWEQTVYSIIKPVIRFIRDECMELPPLTKDVRSCEMSATQKRIYKELKTEFLAEYNEGIITAVNEGVKLGKLLQVATGCIYDKDKVAHELDCRPKLKLLEETIEESGRKCIVSTPYTHSIDMLQRFIEKKGYTVKVVNGKVGARKRFEIFQHFQEGDLQVLLVHPEVIAHGLNLTSSSTIVWWGPIDSFDYYDQANGRITRAGQKHPQLIRHLVCSEVERGVYRRLETKESMQGLLLEMIRS